MLQRSLTCYVYVAYQKHASIANSKLGLRWTCPQTHHRRSIRTHTRDTNAPSADPLGPKFAITVVSGLPYILNRNGVLPMLVVALGG